MPAFVFISGHLSTPHLTHKRIISLCQMMVVFVLFEFFYYLENQVMLYEVIPAETMPLSRVCIRILV